MTTIDTHEPPVPLTTREPILIAVWWEGKGWWWDTVDESGGYDRCVAQGPSYHPADALDDAQNCFGPDAVVAISSFNPPDHYPAVPGN